MHTNKVDQHAVTTVLPHIYTNLHLICHYAANTFLHHHLQPMKSGYLLVGVRGVNTCSKQYSLAPEHQLK